MNNSVIIHTRDKAWAQLSDQSFQQAWKHLYDDCPWATPFQSPAFVCSWFDNYRSRYSPIIISLPKADQRLYGLLVLAMSVEQRRLVVAGAHQAEYQVWLATTDSHGDFITRALAALDLAFPGCNLVFKYLPNEVPVQVLLEEGAVAKRAELKLHQRPLIQIDKKDLDDSFRKKSNKSRFNRLQRLGELKFERITDEKIFTAIFDEIIDLYDFRQGAVNNTLPFLQDTLKKPFHLDMMKQHPKLLHVTLTTLDSKPIAAHIGIVGKDQVHVAILAYSPFYAHHSPGKLHLMLLGRQFVQEGCKWLDLTPGGAWKERFANSYDEVYELVLHKSAGARAIRVYLTQMLDWLKGTAKSVGIVPDRVRRFYKCLQHIRLSNIVDMLSRAVWEKAELRIYRYTTGSLLSASYSGQMKKDYLPDLLKFDPAESSQTKGSFLAEALQRMERGEHIYTFASGERLLYYGWISERQGEFFLTEVQHRFQYPDKSAVLYDFYIHPQAGGYDFYQESLQQILSDVNKCGGVKWVYISIREDNGPFLLTLDKIGFEHQCSLFYYRVLGFIKKGIYFSPRSENK